MTRLRSALLVACSILTTSCSNEYYYKKGLADAYVPENSETVTSLTEVKPENTNLKWKEINGNKYVLAVSWKAAQDTRFYKNDASGFYNTQGYPIFVTVAPDLQIWCNQHKITPSDTSRIKQLLGLPLTSTKGYFVEFWVNPKDLVRPCLDTGITDNTCGLTFDKFISPENLAYLTEQKYNSFINPDPQKNYPFTMLGYTYDWSKNNRKHVGLSEFVIPKNRKIVVKSIKSTAEYLNAKQP
jgi:hypothetical protein